MIMLNSKNSSERILAPDGIIAVNKESQVIVFNESAARITGYEMKEVMGSDFRLLFDEMNEGNSLINQSLSSGEIFSNISLIISRRDSGKLRVTSSLTPVTQPAHGTIGVIIVFRDMQETLSLYNALEEKNLEIIEEKNRLETIFNSLLEGTFTINSDWDITSFNDAAEKITGYSKEEAVGKKYWNVFPDENGVEDLQLRDFISEHNQSLLREHTIIKRDGSRILVRINSAPLIDTSGRKIGRVVTFEDISAMKNLSDHIEEKFGFDNIIGRSKPMLKVFNMMENVLNTGSTVLITGESGTGKEIIARAIHLNSERKSEPFVAVNCTAFAESLLESELFGHEKGAFTGAVSSKPGRFELAGNGTLFLDEIGDLPLSVQVKLLRVLENRQFERVGGTKTLNLNARIVSATHRDLEKEIKADRFREDLFYRINVINIQIPALHERKDDLPSLVNHFMDKFNNKFKKDIHYISPAVLKIFMHYRWPGNIRELENAIEHAFVVCNSDAIKIEHLPSRFQNISEENILEEEENNPFENVEKQLIKSTLANNGGNKNKTAQALNISKTTLWRKIKKYNL